MKCFYHTDVDGKCAGAIVKKWWNSVYRAMQDGITGDCAEFFSIDYKDEFPFDKILPNEQVIIVDFSLQKEGEFEKLRQITEDIIWIDHHKTAIEKHPTMVDLKGKRDVSKAGCELTWEYFFPDKEMPLAVKYAGRYDVWDFSQFGEILNEFQAGIRLEEHYPQSPIWEELFKKSYKPSIDESVKLASEGTKISIKPNGEIEGLDSVLEIILKEGKIALKFRTNNYASLIKAFSFFTEFEGYKAICCNVGATSSQLFDSVKEDYDLMIPFVFDGKQWTVSLYTKKDIDCSEIAKKYGGGGHKQAAGFQCKTLPFIIGAK
jgi:oligoribonuclease NrnB/cAMP/cGMP phosphodiesterase (DHH superfamily)